jgi:hypothetical protein
VCSDGTAALVRADGNLSLKCFSNPWSVLCVQYFLLQLHVRNTNIIGVYLTGVHLIGVYLIGVYLMQNVYSCTIDCTHSAMLGIFPAP